MANTTYTVKNVDSFIITGFDNLSHQKLLGFLILISYMLILLGNSVNLCIISTDRHLHRPMYLFICNLAAVDIIYTTSCSTTMISVLLAEIKTVSFYSCISRLFIHHLNDLTGCLALSLMALDRLIAIRLPLRYHTIMTNSHAFLLILVSWLCGFAVIGLLTAVAHGLPYCQPVIRYVFCDYPAMIRAACVDPEPYFQWPALLSIWPLCIQFPFILCTYAVLAYSVTKLANTSNRKQMISTCVSHLIVLLSYYVPKLVSLLLTRMGVVLSLTQRNAIVIASSLVPPLINPTVYSIRTKEIRKRLVNVLLGKKVIPIH